MVILTTTTGPIGMLPALYCYKKVDACMLTEFSVSFCVAFIPRKLVMIDHFIERGRSIRGTCNNWHAPSWLV